MANRMKNSRKKMLAPEIQAVTAVGQLTDGDLLDRFDVVIERADVAP